MIQIDVEDYCQNCPDFEPTTESFTYHDNDYEVVKHDTTIHCKYRERCAGVYAYMQQRSQEEK